MEKDWISLKNALEKDRIPLKRPGKRTGFPLKGLAKGQDSLEKALEKDMISLERIGFPQKFSFLVGFGKRIGRWIYFRKGEQAGLTMFPSYPF